LFDARSGNRAGHVITCRPGRLTTHFEGVEFRCPCDCRRIFVSFELVNLLERLRRQVEAPIVIESGYRCPVHNAEVGGDDRSLHTLGLAADITIPGLTIVELHALARSYWLGDRRGGVGFYPGHVHLDVGNAREWNEMP